MKCKLQNGDRLTNLTCDWVVGADGAHSVVRKQSQIPFNGETYSHNFYLADIEVDNPVLNDGKVHLYLAKKSFLRFLPNARAKTGIGH